MSPEEWAEKFGDELRADAGDWCWNKQHEEKLALYFRQAIEEATKGENNVERLCSQNRVDSMGEAS